MIRKALIIYCNNTHSGRLHGPAMDNLFYRAFLKSTLGGEWKDDEIISLQNPTLNIIASAKTIHLSNADYTFTIFSGHGGFNTDDNRQYLEITGGDIPLNTLITNANRQTIIVDACRGYYSRMLEKSVMEGLGDAFSGFSGVHSTRQLFDNAVMGCEQGLTVLYAASENQTALDTNNGGAYLCSLLEVADAWENRNTHENVFSLKSAHEYATDYLRNNFNTIQRPAMNSEKRHRYYPFAVK